MLLEQICIYSAVLLLCGMVVYFYLKKEKKASKIVEAKIEQAKVDGIHEPVSLYPAINLDSCIKSGACVEACPEKDIIGILDGRGTLIKASNCVGHGACFHACPVEAISLVIGTAKRGVDLPHVSENYESNVEGIYIAGELGGMGLIKNSVEQGQVTVENIIKSGLQKDYDGYDLIIVGAGPAGIAASLMAKKHGLNFLTIDQYSLGGTVFNFPRSKIVMTAPMNLPLHGKVQLQETSKQELLDLWTDVLAKNNITIQDKTKVDSIQPEGSGFLVMTNRNQELSTQKVLLAIGRRGSPRKLGVPGEQLEKVAYRLLEPELLSGKKVLVVGGGDSAVEAAMSLVEENEVVLSYRKDAFSRIKPKNRERLNYYVGKDKLEVIYNSNVMEITPTSVDIKTQTGRRRVLDNDLVYIFAGGELPTQFLQKAGVEITKRFGYTMRKYG